MGLLNEKTRWELDLQTKKQLHLKLMKEPSEALAEAVRDAFPSLTFKNLMDAIPRLCRQMVDEMKKAEAKIIAREALITEVEKLTIRDLSGVAGTPENEQALRRQMFAYAALRDYRNSIVHMHNREGGESKLVCASAVEKLVNENLLEKLAPLSGIIRGGIHLLRSSEESRGPREREDQRPAPVPANSSTKKNGMKQKVVLRCSASTRFFLLDDDTSEEFPLFMGHQGEEWISSLKGSGNRTFTVVKRRGAETMRGATLSIDFDREKLSFDSAWIEELMEEQHPGAEAKVEDEQKHDGAAMDQKQLPGGAAHTVVVHDSQIWFLFGVAGS